jgi:hypothetical protein
MPLLPAITVVFQCPASTAAPLPLHRFVESQRLDELLLPAVRALLHTDSLAHSTASGGIVPLDRSARPLPPPPRIAAAAW